MMRPMKLAGDQLLFGAGCLEHLKSIEGRHAVIVVGGQSMRKSGILDTVQEYLTEAGITTAVYEGVEPDPSFRTVLNGADFMLQERPDWIIALGGGSAMDAAKAMWIYYEHPQLKKLSDILPPNPFPKLREKARLLCIPSTSGTASEVSRSIVITDNDTHLKYGIGNMEMMPDIAICDPVVTATMPAKITAETGLDALTHALEALVSNRANTISHILASAAIEDILNNLPLAYKNGSDLVAREKMLNASMTAGMAFTNVSLGIVHSMAHTLGSLFGIAHGLADAVLLPYVIRFNSDEPTACKLYADVVRRHQFELGKAAGDGTITVQSGADQVLAVQLADLVDVLNARLGIPKNLRQLIPDQEKFNAQLPEMVRLALLDGCTKTNPIIPDQDTLTDLFQEAYGK